ncbi:hypothetical protein HY385_00240 [Candidatus Daviesbacteria bacterium]|nr:hypothetical protein [Candidatus Daviesbacteria bacterium]
MPIFRFSKVQPTLITSKTVALNLSIFLLFLLLVFDQQVAMIYLLMLTAYFIWFTFDDKITLPIEKTTQGRWMSLLYAIGIYAGFLLASTTLSTLFSLEGGQTAFSIIDILSAQTPVLAGNKILTFIAWGITIPIIETVFFFGVLYEGLATHIGKFMGVGELPTSLKPLNGYYWFLILFISIIFTAYHFQARGLTDSTGLFVTFLFSVVSLIAVSFFGQTREAILFHLISNSVAVLSRMGYLNF